MFRKELGEGQAGDNVGILLRGVEKSDIQRGHVIAAPGSIKPHTKAKAQIYVCLTKKKEVVIPHSSRDIALNSSLEQLMLLVMLSFLKELKW